LTCLEASRESHLVEESDSSLVDVLGNGITVERIRVVDLEALTGSVTEDKTTVVELVHWVHLALQ